MTNAADMGGTFRRAIEYIESCASPITIEQLLEAYGIAGMGGSDEQAAQIRDQYRQAVDAQGPEGGPQLVRELFVETMGSTASMFEYGAASAAATTATTATAERDAKWWQFWK